MNKEPTKKKKIQKWHMDSTNKVSVSWRDLKLDLVFMNLPMCDWVRDLNFYVENVIIFYN